MAVSRPHLKASIETLEKLFQKGNQDSSVLEALRRELDHRATERAKKLKSKVLSAIAKTKSEKPTIKKSQPHILPSKTNPQRKHSSIAHRESREDAGGGLGSGGEMTMQDQETDRFSTLDPAEKTRLQTLYSGLREKLLDLTKRNRMLNYSFGARSKRHLQIVDEVPEIVYGRLVGENISLELKPIPEPDDIPADEKTEEFVAALDHAKVSEIEYLTELAALESSGRDDDHTLLAAERNLRKRLRERLEMPPRPERSAINRNEHAKRYGIDVNPELPKEASKSSHRDKFLQTPKFPDELESALEKIGDDARLAEQEMGLSTLFLSFGFLEWYESDASDKKYFAPLLLLPVKLSSRTHLGKKIFSITAAGGVAEANLSLQKFLERKFNRTLPNFDPEDEEAEGSIESYLQQVMPAIEGLSRWHIRRWAVLGHFVFGRLAMYADLAPENWHAHPAGQRLIQSVLAGTDTAERSSALPSIPTDYEIDDPDIEKIAPYLIHDADASQHSALIDVAKGHDLVVEGPPGTGKSQTITNIIANALALGQTVLFLAEKQAALEVVKRRLDIAGLGNFCLELHSDKSSSKKIVESLKARIELGFVKGKLPASSVMDATWQDSRRTISDYLSILHAPEQDGRALYDNIWEAVRGYAAHPELQSSFKNVKLPAALLNKPDEIPAVIGRLEFYARGAQQFIADHGHAVDSPWRNLVLDELAAYQIDEFIDYLEKLLSASKAIASFNTDRREFVVTRFDYLRKIAVELKQLPDAPDTDIVSEIKSLDMRSMKQALDVFEKRHATTALLLSKPDLSQFANTILSRAARLLADTKDPVGYGSLTPRQIYKAFEQIKKEVEPAVSAVSSLVPALSVLGLDSSFNAQGMDAVTATIICVANLKPYQRLWLKKVRSIDSDAFELQREQWSQLNEDEIRWRKRTDSDLLTWPSSNEISVAAKTLTKGLVGTMFAKMGRSHAEALSLLHRIGSWQGNLPTSDELLALHHHIKSIEAFLDNSAIGQQIGAAWAGLKTPFNDIAAGLKVGDLLTRVVSSLPEGPDVLKRALELDTANLDALSAFEAPAKNFRALERSARIQPKGKTAEFVESLASILMTAHVVLEADATRSLDDIDIPCESIVAIYELRKRQNEMDVQLNQIQVASKLEPLVVDIFALSRVRAAVSWIEMIGGLQLSPLTKESLLGRDAGDIANRIRAEGAKLQTHLDHVDNANKEIAERFSVQIPAKDSPEEQVTQLTDLMSKQAQLPLYLSLTSERHAIESSGLSDFLETSDRIKLRPDLLSSTLATLLAHRRALKARHENSSLNKLTGSALDARRSVFAERDRKKIERDRSVVRAQLLPAKPERGNAVGPRKTWTEMVLIENELKKQQRFIPLRTLIQRSHRSLQALTPCFMMSPLSLAKFLPAGHVKFDLVVIDEASQMRPEDSLGGLLRGKQIVVVGDPKQLPPTDFFTRANSAETDDENEIDTLDDESILEACQKAFGQVRRLKWHYRSRCESLIAFSNRNFYDNSLITFPMSRPGSFSVDVVRLNGTYQGRQNVAEAVRLAEDAISFMRHYSEQKSKDIPTIGIVAVNTEQRDLIKGEIRRLSTGDELVENYQAKVTDRGEPVFVKNLENVQGDERDFILISMTYGPEPGAKVVKQRFGPINGKHGHRRLNVLFSRARQRIALYTSMTADDIKPSETSHQGVHILKQYLEYADSRGRAAVETVGRDVDSDFEAAVADRLRARGYQVDYQVGVSGFRIDLGVRHPDHPETFLAGIECDGAAYHSSKSARDRDRLREEVLRGLGWNLLRVWSTDWFQNAEEETRKLVAKLEVLRTQTRSTSNEEFSFTTIASEESEATATHTSDAPEPAIDETFTSGNIGDHSIEPTQAGAIDVDTGPISTKFAVKLLRDLRENEIAKNIPEWEAERSIVREGMIETLVSERVIDQDQWFLHVPQYQRQNTNKLEKDRYFDRICDIIGRIEGV